MMINQNLSQSPKKETTISKQTRSAFLVAVLFAIGAIANFVISLGISLEEQTLLSYLDTVAVFCFIIVAISSAMTIRAGEKERGVWRLLVGLIIVLGVRNFLYEDLGFLFGAIGFIAIPLIALVTLNPKIFNRTLATGILTGSAYLIFDILISRYLPPYRQFGESIIPITRIGVIVAIVLAASFVISIIQRGRYLQISSKLILAMTVIVIVPLIILGIISTLSLRDSLEPRIESETISRSAFVAENINSFVKTTKDALLFEASSPDSRGYLLTNPSDAENLLRDSMINRLQLYQRKDFTHIESYAILDINGQNVLDTVRANIGNDESNKTYFTEALETSTAHISVQRVSGTTEYKLFFSAPILTVTGESIGVLRAQYNIDVLEAFFENYVVLTTAIEGTESFAALLYEIPTNPLDEFDPEAVYMVLANSGDDTWNFKIANHLTTNVITPLQTGGMLPPGSTAQLSLNLLGLEEGLADLSDQPIIFEGQAFPREGEITNSVDLIGVVPIEENPDWFVITSQNLVSINEPFALQRETITYITVLIAIGAIALTYFGSGYLIAPILNITEVAEKVSEGDFSTQAPVSTEDEIGVLGTAFNTMTGQLNNLVTTLEDRVNSRTADLERRTQQLQAAVEVGKVAVSLHDLDNLLTQATELISLRFGFYHIGIFLLDEKGEYAVLRASNSDGGKRMLKRNHKLKVGETGIVGYVTRTGQARIALDVGQDSTYFDNPDLPQTRSEMALALIAGGNILGALDIQSTQGQAFSDADIATLQVLADQIAISIENARLFEQNRETLQALRRAYGEQSFIGWQELVHTQKHYGYQGKDDGSIVSIVEPTSPEFIQGVAENDVLLDHTRSTANIPILVRGNPIGVLRLSKSETAPSWSENELELAQTLSTELSGAMESARLFSETRKQAEQEYIIGEITNKMRETLNVESVIRMAADEIYKLLDLEHITIHFTPDGENGNGKEDAA